MDQLNELSTSTQIGRDDNIVSRLEDIMFPTEKASNEVDEAGEQSLEAAEEPTEIAEELTTKDDEALTETDDQEDEESAAEAASEEDEDVLELAPEQLAAVLGVEDNQLVVGDDGSIRLVTKAGDEIEDVKISDLVQSFQTQKHVTKKSQALAEDTKAFDAAKEQASQLMQQKFGEVAAVAQTLEQQLNMEYDSINWDALRQQNPAEWTAKRQEFGERVQKLQAMKQQAHKALTDHLEAQKHEVAQKMQQKASDEAQLLVGALPHWSNPDVASTEHSAMQNFLVDAYGFTPEDVGSVNDHRLILLALDAQKYRATQQKTDVALKKVKKVPKIQKPQAAGTKKRLRSDDAAKKRKIRLKKTGSVKDAAAVLMDRL